MTTSATETFTLTLTNERSGGTVVLGAHNVQDVTMWDVAENDGRTLVTYDNMSWRIADVQRQTDGTLSVGLVRQTRKGTDYVRNGYLWTSIEHLSDAMQTVIRASVPTEIPCTATEGNRECAYRAGHDLSVFPHRFVAPAPVAVPKLRPCGGMTLVQIQATADGIHHTTAIVDPFRVRTTRELVKYRVQRNIFCPITGKVLDIRTAVALFAPEDGGGFVLKTVLHPDAWPIVKGNALKNFPTWYVWHMPIR